MRGQFTSETGHIAGKMGGRKGGYRRAALLPSSVRQRIARNAALAVPYESRVARGKASAAARDQAVLARHLKAIGSAGGRATALLTTPEERRAQGLAGALKRWGKQP